MSRPLVDVLAHLDDSRIVEPAALLARAATAGVEDVVNAGVDPVSDALEFPPAPGARVWRAFGVHPKAAGGALGEKLERLAERLDEQSVVAVGECGLDRRDGMPELAEQESAFRSQLALARARGLPVILHVVQATGHALRLLEAAGPLPGGYWHGFTGAPEVARALADKHGLHISFGGQAANPKARRCRASAASVPLDRLLLESGTPDHYPGSADTERLSEPANLVLTLSAVASLRAEPLEDIAAATAGNARRLLGLPKPE